MNETQIPMPIKVKPYKHQIDAFDFVCGLFGVPSSQIMSQGAALLMEMGTGKTLTTIAVAGALFCKGCIERMLIVSPFSIVGVWDEEFKKYADFQFNLTVLNGVVTKKKEQLRKINTGALGVAVVNYESAWRMEKELAAWNADLIVCDEGHKIKGHNISASKAMHRLGARAKYRMLLTGTLITNKALDVFSQYKFLNPSIFGQSFYAFRNRYFDMVGYGKHTPVLKKSLEAELTAKLHSIAYRAIKSECLDLPKVIEITRIVELEPNAEKLYRNLAKSSYAELGKSEITVTNILTRLLRLSQITGGFMSSDDGGKVQKVSEAKLSALNDIIETASEEGKKLVIIARFIPELDAICKLLRSKGLRYSLIMGGVYDRGEQVRQFQNDASVTLFVGQIATAGLGITLTAASTMVFYSLDYSMSNFEQTKARIHRVGQKQSCTYIYLLAKNTVDEKVLKALKEKADLAKTLIDDYRQGRNPFI